MAREISKAIPVMTIIFIEYNLFSNSPGHLTFKWTSISGFLLTNNLLNNVINMKAKFSPTPKIFSLWELRYLNREISDTNQTACLGTR